MFSAERRGLALAVVALAAVVVAANILVQYPVQARLGPLDLADLLTWGAFTYPLSFLIIDLTNRTLGAPATRRLVFIGFAIAVALSMAFATPRIAIASGSAFLISQLLDVAVFDRLRRQAWWKAPAISSVIGSFVDTLLFFSMAFAAAFAVLGPNLPFALEPAPILGLASAEAPRWVSWALGDFVVKLLMTAVALVPYRVLIGWFLPFGPARA